MFRIASIAVLAAAAAAQGAEAHFHDNDQHHHYMRHRHEDKAVEMAKTHAHVLEQQYLDDCAVRPQPHGYYGAFLQPCTFTFLQTDPSTLPAGDACASGTVVGRPVPMHWLFNQTSTSFWDKNNWRDVYDFGSSSSSSDSFDMDKVDWDAFAEHLMLWPDQCVGAGPRCYSIDEGMGSSEAVMEALHRLFPDEAAAPWTLSATHVQVDCQADAMELSRIVYATADVVDRAIPAIVAVSMAAVAIAVVIGMWCCYASARLYKAWNDRGMTEKVRRAVHTGVAAGKAHYSSQRGKYQYEPTVVIVADPTDAKSVEMSGASTEYKRLLA